MTAKQLIDEAAQKGIKLWWEPFDRAPTRSELVKANSYLTKIANAAFSVGAIRPSRLEDVYYEGTREQWEQIEVLGEDKGSVAESLWLNATIHFKNSPIVLPEEPIQPEVRAVRGVVWVNAGDIYIDDVIVFVF